MSTDALAVVKLAGGATSAIDPCGKTAKLPATDCLRRQQIMSHLGLGDRNPIASAPAGSAVPSGNAVVADRHPDRFDKQGEPCGAMMCGTAIL